MIIVFDFILVDELQEIAGDDTQEESLYIENQMTVFTELFLDESKMKVSHS